MRPFRRLLLAWAGLLVLLALEAGSARLLGWSLAAPLFGATMAVVVAVMFMHADEGPALVRVFAVAGAFWLCVLLGLGSLDALTRTDHPVAMQTAPAP